MNRWEAINNILLVSENETEKELRFMMKLKELLTKDFKKVSVLTFHLYTKDVVLADTTVCTLLKRDFNFFGKLKSSEKETVIQRQYDAVFYFSDMSKKAGKVCAKFNTNSSIALNCSGYDCELVLESEAFAPEKLLNFVKNSLQKVSA